MHGESADRIALRSRATKGRSTPCRRWHRTASVASGPTPLSGLAKTVERTRVYGGIDVSARFGLAGATVTPRIYARAARDSGDASGTADLVFAGAQNGAVPTAFGPGVGPTVVQLGGALDVAVGSKMHLWAGYDGSFRSGARIDAAKAGVTIDW